MNKVSSSHMYWSRLLTKCSIHKNDLCLQNIIDEVKQNSGGEYLVFHPHTDFEYYYQEIFFEGRSCRSFPENVSVTFPTVVSYSTAYW